MKFQVNVSVNSVLSRMPVGVTVRKLFRIALVSDAGTLLAPVPLTATESTAAVTLLVKSASLTVKVPLLVKPASVSVKPTESGPSVMTGASLVPVMVTVTASVSDNGVPSSSVALTV